MNTVCKDILIGGGVNGDAGNRWYDKRLQVIEYTVDDQLDQNIQTDILH